MSMTSSVSGESPQRRHSGGPFVAAGGHIDEGAAAACTCGEGGVVDDDIAKHQHYQQVRKTEL